VRKLVWTLLSLALISPTAGLALGLGEIHLHSALNQSLQADIDLLSVGPKEVDKVKVNLASYQEFSRVGVDRPAVLMFLKFKVHQAPDGRYLIEVTSDKPIREPFLDFLVEVNWPTGRLLREYTLLLDPPEMMKESAPKVVTARAGKAPTSPAPAKAAPEPTPAPAGQQHAGRELVYGPVKKNDTLWSIASDMRPNKSVSVPQVMMALLKANPEAFYNGNVNRLKAGYVLRVDDPSLIRAMSRAEAYRELRRQSRSWQDFKQQEAGSVEQRPSRPSEPAPAAASAANEKARLRLVTPDKEEKTADTGAAPSGEADSAATDNASLGQVRQQLLLAQEATAAQQRENQELRKRMKELEQQVASMQRLLSLKNNDLANLQQQASEAGKQSAAAPAGSTSPESAAPVVPAPEAAVPESKPAEPKSEAAKPAPPQPVAAAKPKPKPKPHRAPKATKPVPSSTPDPIAFARDLMGDPVIAGGLAGVVLILVLLLWLIVRRRKAGNFQESILSGGTSSMLNAKSEGGEGRASEETSFLSDFAISGMGDIHADDAEVDPLTEADVYMAYGRHQQAEELLKEAIKANPERNELLIKLLELYYTTKNKEAFAARADEAFSGLGGSGPLWDKVQRMGHELVPDNPMFNAAPENADAAEAQSSDESPVSDEVLDIGLDLDALTAEMEPSAEEAAAAGENADEFDLDLGVDFSDLDEGTESKAADETPEVEAAAPEAEEPVAESADADLAGLDWETEQPDEGAETAEEEEPAVAQTAFGDGESHLETFDTESVLEDAEASVPAEAEQGDEASGQADGNALDFDLDGFGFSSEDKGEAPVAQESASEGDDNSLDFDLSGLELNDEEASAEETPAQPTEEPQAFETVGTDEMEGPAAESSAEIEATAIDATPSEEENSLDFDLEGFREASEAEPEAPAVSAPSAAAPEPASADVASADELPDLDLNLDEELGVGEDDEFFSDLDEIGTKLDLAKAYIDMGDGDGARSILDEVVKEGDQEQRQQAEQLLKQIA
jgi:pilus assembly protein FimV